MALAFGGASGFVNGWLITRFKIDSFIVTLSMMFLYMGLRSGISAGSLTRCRIPSASSASRRCSVYPTCFSSR